MARNERIVIADDHPLFRAALRQTLLDEEPTRKIVEAETLDALERLGDALSDADLLLLDLKMPGAHGFSGLVFLRGQFPTLPIVIVSATEDPAVMHRAIRYGALGYVPKSASPAEIARALAVVLAGDTYLPEAAGSVAAGGGSADDDLAERVASLTPHQFRVFTMLREGLLNKQIAYELGVSEATIKAHVTAILRKLGVTNRTQAVVAADRLALPAAAEDDHAAG